MLAIDVQMAGPDRCAFRRAPPPACLTFRPPFSALVAVGCMDGSATVLLVSIGAEWSLLGAARASAHSKRLSACVLSPDGALLATGSPDAALRVYAVHVSGEGGGGEAVTLSPQWRGVCPGPVQHAVFAPDPAAVLADAGLGGSGGAGSERVFPVELPLDGSPTQSQHSLLVASRNTPLLLVLDTAAGTWRGLNLNEKPRDAHVSFAPLKLAPHAAGRVLAVLHDLGGTLLVDLRRGSLLHAMHAVPMDEFSTPSVAWASPSAPVLLVAGKDAGLWHALHAGTATHAASQQAHTVTVRAFAAAQWGGKLAVASCAFDKCVTLWAGADAETAGVGALEG